MKLRRTLRFHNIKRPKIRQTWNKYNLYNLYKLQQRLPPYTRNTLFQQKWLAKKLTRGYHGEHIKEYQWERMFSRRLNGAVNMDPTYMAAFDGSEQAAGRGSGKQVAPLSREEAARRPGKGYKNKMTNVKTPGLMTPYMNMTFAPQERRLDISVFRALFASSARQARQFVVHGAVKVNGKTMHYPGYLLNPGDLFQVDPERVLFATGAKKRKESAYAQYLDKAKTKKNKPKPSETEALAGDAAAEDVGAIEASSEVPVADSAGAGAAGLEGPVAEAPAATPPPEAAKSTKATVAPTSAKADTETDLQKVEKLITRARNLLTKIQGRVLQGGRGQKITFLRPKNMNLMKRKRAIRRFILACQGTISAVSEKPVRTAPIGVVKQLRGLLTELGKEQGVSTAVGEGNDKLPAAVAKASAVQNLNPAECQKMWRVLRGDRHNPVDPSKPYATPWRPRPFMSPFVFIPRYLEVNQHICAAVYLRHPVARPGQSEVPTPYPEAINQLAHNWYLRRR